MTIGAYKNAVVLEPDVVEGREKKTESGIFFKESDTMRDGPRVFLSTGTVVSSGIKEILAGDKVGYNPYDAFEFKWEEKTYATVVEAGLRVVFKK